MQERFDLSKSAMGLVILGHVDRRHPRRSRSPARRSSRHGSARMAWLGGIAVRARRQPAACSRRRPLLRGGRPVRARRRERDDGRVDEQPRRQGRAATLGRPIMSSLHAGWAFGGMAGAGFAAALRRAGRRPAHHRGDRLGAAAARRCSSSAPRASATAPPPRARTRRGFTLPSRGVAAARVLCLLVMVTEGAMADWGGLYLRQDLGASAAARRARLLLLLRPA